LGHSNSGAVALRFAADAPERTLGAIVADSVGAQPYRNVPRMLAGRAVDAVFEPYFTAYASAHLAFNLMRHGKPFLHQVAIARDTDALAIAERVTAPLLIAWGTKDRTLVPAAAERLHERAPHAEVVWVNGRHDCLVECAAEFAQKILPFLERVTLPRPADHA
jgi:pimeloyl-ACP methyl ester carboxylesterase